MSKPDKDLQDRLSNLNATTNPLPSDDELATRFNKLFAADPTVAQRVQAAATSYSVPSGADEMTDEEIERILLEESLLDGTDDDLADLFSSSKPSTVTAVTAKSTLFDRRLDATVSAFVDRDPALLGGSVASDADTNALIQQLSEEAELENKYGGLRKKMDEALEERYRRLMEGGIPRGRGTDQAGKVTGSRQGEEAPRLGPPPKAARREEFKNEEDEIENWCSICNEDATIICHGCDDDRYCATCFREVHTGPDADYDAKGHRWAKFIVRKTV
ncbi:hypothetical protein BC937DRAFT_86817 [Endogone sp. FLAS-F59071]|nr:hypothetical protein BC937DRAFT_86817 [Endogone sp. FLAS-F59071]|eukprot:RUS12878.1 hypothetical protein BC937DRAFT_86817 [Endogone sp. FLAS-F59071]